MEQARLARLNRRRNDNKPEQKVFVDEMKNSMLCVDITNVSAAMNLGVRLPLKQIVLHSHDVEYVQSKMDTLETQLRKPEIEKVKIYASGKMVVLGARSIEGARKGARIIARRLEKLNYPVRLSKYKVFNIFSKAQVPFKIDLDLLKSAYPQHCVYDLEIDHFCYYYKDKTSLGLSKDNRYKSLIKFTRNGKIIIFALDMDEMVELGQLANKLAGAFRIKKQSKLVYTVYDGGSQIVKLEEYNINTSQVKKEEPEENDILNDLLT